MRRPALIVMDIEGGEAGLLDPRRAPALLGVDIIVETHPTLVDGVDATLGSWFRHSHVVERIEPWPNDRTSLAGLLRPLPPPLDTDPTALRLAVAEHRDLPTPSRHDRSFGAVHPAAFDCRDAALRRWPRVGEAVSMMMPPDVAAQRAYYARTATTYDTIHGDDELGIGLAPLIGYARLADARSILDVGSGTGRALRQLKTHLPPQVRIIGVEPSAELRAVGYERHGLAPDELIDGNALALPFEDGAFDVVCATGVLHHIRDHRHAVAEMLRVAERAVFICDGNHLAHGTPWRRVGKRWLRRLRLWRLANWVKTGGRGYWESEHEAPAYPYTAFADLPLLRRSCATVHIMNLSGDGAHAYRHAGSVAMLALKER